MECQVVDDSLLIIALKNAWILIMGVFGWIGRGMHADIKALQKSDADCKLDLAEFKAKVATDYTDKQTMQSSLARIHDRLDNLPGEIISIIRGK